VERLPVDTLVKKVTMIRWSPRKVKEAMDKTEELVNRILPILEQARQVVAEAKKIPCLPNYMTDRMSSLESDIESITGGVFRYSNTPFKGRLHNRIDYIRSELPKEDLAREQAEFDKLVAFFNGDTAKAEMTLNLGKPKPREVPKEQLAMGWITGKPEPNLASNETEFEGESDELLSEV